MRSTRRRSSSTSMPSTGTCQKMAEFARRQRRAPPAAREDAQIAAVALSRSRTARSASAARRSARPRRWCAAASRTCSSATRSSAREAAPARGARRRTPDRLVLRCARRRSRASRAAKDFGVSIGGLVEIEVGMQRCGVEPGAAAVDLARRIAEAPGLRFDGLQAYHGPRSIWPRRRPRAGDRRRRRLGAQDGRRAGGSPAIRASGQGAGTGTYPIEGDERPVERAARRLLRLHGRRLRADRRARAAALSTSSSTACSCWRR